MDSVTSSLKVDPEFKSLIPPLSGDELWQLEHSLLEEGCRDALVVWDGVLVDGHNRYAICEKHGISFETVERSFEDRDAARVWILGNQIGRRNLSDGWRIELALQMKELLAKKGQERKVEEGKKARDKQLGVLSEIDNTPTGKSDNDSTPQPSQPEPQPKHNTQAEIAKAAKVSTGKVGMAEVVRKRNPELWEKAKQGEVTISKAYSDVKRSERRDQRISEIKASGKDGPDLPSNQQWPVIYADPPWRYEHSKTHSRDIENQYPTMDLSEICQMPVSDIATKDAVLFLWVTSPKLVEGIQVLENWGFAYRTCAVWDKEKIGMGYYFRQQHELLLVGTRGQIPVPEPSARVSSVFREARGKHSTKPEIFYDIIEGMYPEFPKLELFARERRLGWDAWGNQV